jgi:hypothetical protein
MSTDYRALCAELLAAIQLYTKLNPAACEMSASELTGKLMDAMAATTAALSQPEPVAPPMPMPGDAEGLAEVFWGRYEQPEPVAPTNLDAEFRSWYGDRYGRSYFGGIALVECVEWTQFVLAHWGTPAIEPVPVSERLPGVGDCDANGRCWLTSVDVEPGWVTDNPEQCTNWTHWLPHWALPVPAIAAELEAQ